MMGGWEWRDNGKRNESADFISGSDDLSPARRVALAGVENPSSPPTERRRVGMRRNGGPKRRGRGEGGLGRGGRGGGKNVQIFSLN